MTALLGKEWVGLLTITRLKETHASSHPLH